VLFKDIFNLPIDRPIDSVIKSTDENSFKSELEEYVVTPEVARSLQRFCDEYNSPSSTCNGAWISGFYGSGKSHLLKILSHLIENKPVGGKPALDYIKPKIADNGFLTSSLERACEDIPSESILFNVGGKSDAQRRDTGESLLAAFIKVLNAHCGYYAKEQAHVALLERDLDRAGILADYKTEVERETGRPWDEVASNPLLFGHKVSVVYDRLTGQPEGTTSNIFEYYQNSYHPAPEDFARWAKDYIDRKSVDQPGFRLNFFVDEMGQYVADSIPLLQMLQDIAENLNTVCGRRSWITVISQEDMSEITGKMDSKASGQFSRIQVRFQVHIKIPANDANTVVKRRLLEKKQEALPVIDRLYDRYHGDFKVLLEFPDPSINLKTYQGEEDFEDTYPLVPYQFKMFHDALVGLSRHDAFTGEYVSTGARNMLGTTHKVLMDLKDKGDVDRGDLVPFDALFEGLRDDLKSEVFNAISTAEDHFGDEMGVRVLKALLLVKYAEGFKATAKNLRVLLYSGLSEDATALEERIAQVLRELDAQTYIRRNGEAFEYLTDDEKDVEEDIKREPLTEGDVSQQIGKFLQKDVLDRTKVKYVNGGFSTSFAFDLTVDGLAIGSPKCDLKVDVMTDLTPEVDKQFSFAAPKHLSVALPRETGLVQEVRLWMQTNSYVGRELENGGGRKATILAEKKAANEQRRREIVAMLASQLDEALWGTNLSDISDKVRGQGADRLESGVLEMVWLSYPLLRLLNTAFTSKSILAAATGPKLLEGESLPEYCTEVKRQVGLVCAKSARCVVGGSTQNALEYVFSGGQYGWPVEAVRQAVGVLSLNDQVECLRNDAPLEGADLGRTLAQGVRLDGVEVRLAVGASPEQVEALRVAYRAFSGMTPEHDDAKGLAADIVAVLGHKLDEAHATLPAVSTLPFASHYQERVDELAQGARHRRDWFIANAATAAAPIEETLADLDKMAGFANGRPGQIFRGAAVFLQAQTANIAAVPETAGLAGQLKAVLTDPACYQTSAAPKAKRLQRDMQEAIGVAVGQERAAAAEALDQFRAQFQEDAHYATATDEAKSRCQALFDGCRAQIDRGDQVLAIRQAVPAFKRDQSARLYALIEPAPKPAPERHSSEAEGADEPVVVDEPGQEATAGATPAAKPRVVTVPYTDLSVPEGFGGAILSTSDDVEGFVAALRQALLAHVTNNEKIIL